MEFTDLQRTLESWTNKLQPRNLTIPIYRFPPFTAAFAKMAASSRSFSQIIFSTLSARREAYLSSASTKSLSCDKDSLMVLFI